MADELGNVEAEVENELDQKRKAADQHKRKLEEQRQESLLLKLVNFFRQLFGRKPMGQGGGSAGGESGIPDPTMFTKGDANHQEKEHGPRRVRSGYDTGIESKHEGAVQGEYMAKSSDKSAAHQSLLEIAHGTPSLPSLGGASAGSNLEVNSRTSQIDRRREALFDAALKVSASGWDSHEGNAFMRQLAPIINPDKEKGISALELEDAYFVKTVLDRFKEEPSGPIVAAREAELRGYVFEEKLERFKAFSQNNISPDQLAEAHHRIRAHVEEHHPEAYPQKYRGSQRGDKRRKPESEPNL